jgi:hypothetical protein
MADLHPLFVHGGAVFRAAGGALLLAGMLGPYLVRARRLARDAAATRAAMPAPTPLGDVSERGGEACVEGVLAGGRGARVVGWSAAPAGEPEGGLTLRVGAEEIAIAGPVAVMTGARETAARDPARLARRLGIAPPLGGEGSARRALLLRAGDRVRAHGRLARAPEASRYRESRAGLVLEPIGSTIRLAALRPPRLVAWPLAFWALGAWLGLTGWAIVFVGGGKAALEQARAAPAGSDDGTRLSAAALGAATPWREASLRALVDSLPTDRPEALDRAEAVLTMLGDCPRLAALDVRRGRTVSALRRSDACGILAPGDLLFDAGRLREASLSYRAEGVPLHEPAQRALRRAEAHLAARAWEASAAAVADWAVAAGDGDKDRQEALGCIAAAIRARGGDAGARAALAAGRRAMCRVLAADLAPPAERRRLLGNLGFVWGDAQGMEFAKLLVNRTGQALLEELGPGQGPSPDLYRYGLYPDAYLAKNLPASDWAFTGVFEMGNDIAHMQSHERTHLQEHPYAIFAALVAAGRGDARDAEEVRVHLVGHVALFLAATGDAAGARAALARLADLPDRPSQEPRWVRPGIGALTAGVEALARERPFAMKGVVHGVLDAALAGAYGEQVDGHATNEAVARLRAVVLDREIAVPLQMLEAFARR